jgi:hypothetical protein
MAPAFLEVVPWPMLRRCPNALAVDSRISTISALQGAGVGHNLAMGMQLAPVGCRKAHCEGGLGLSPLDRRRSTILERGKVDMAAGPPFRKTPGRDKVV